MSLCVFNVEIIYFIEPIPRLFVDFPDNEVVINSVNSLQVITTSFFASLAWSSEGLEAAARSSYPFGILHWDDLSGIR